MCAVIKIGINNLACKDMGDICFTVVETILFYYNWTEKKIVFNIVTNMKAIIKQLCKEYSPIGFSISIMPQKGYPEHINGRER